MGMGDGCVPGGGVGYDGGPVSKSTALRISSWKLCDHFRTSAMARPTWRPASGRRLGPSTIRATTRMTRISAGPNEVGMATTLLGAGLLHGVTQAGDLLLNGVQLGPRLGQVVHRRA